jgi:heme-degrading monooxygenase HmoA
MFIAMNRFRINHGFEDAFETVWASRADFVAWTESENFRKAHSQASAPKGTYQGHPDLETFEQVV